jgi:hypothetical protein
MDINLISSIDKEILSNEELSEMTEREHKDAQISWLRERAWHFELSSRGTPKVGRWYARMRLAGIHVPDTISQEGGMPDFSKAR